MATSAEDAPLARGSLAGSDEALVFPARPAGSSNSRALKVAGLTTLVCLLLGSQVFTAYMVFGQKQQIHQLQRNSDHMSKQLVRSSQGKKRNSIDPIRCLMQMPMNSLPLLTNFPAYDSSKTSQKPVKDIVVSVEKQVKNLLQDFQPPQFNETFMANLQGLKSHMNETEWQSFESWMRFWLIFQMAQQKPAPPTADPASLTKCQKETRRDPSKLGSYMPQCDEQGNYKPVQCWHATGFCFCVDQSGKPIDGTFTRGIPDCQRGPTAHRLMLAPSMMARSISMKDGECLEFVF
uniref:Thyroglobulin type-1 domain-containing protein n=1 Tax=Mola mola TaxID=94237 RepID=A0A3Q3VY44_MOLML